MSILIFLGFLAAGVFVALAMDAVTNPAEFLSRPFRTYGRWAF